MQWLNKTPKDTMIFSEETGPSAFEWHMDASFAAHPDFRSHTGGSARFGGGQGCPINIGESKS